MEWFNELLSNLSLSNVVLYKASLWDGFLLTIELGLVSLFVSLIFGIVAAICSLSRFPFLRGITLVYTTLIRGVPDIVLIFLFFYGIQLLLNHVTLYLQIGIINLDPFIVGVITIGFMFGAFMAETFRGALLAVPRGQMESATAFGMSTVHIYRRIILPQAMRYAIPGISNNWLVMLKTTALVSLINLKDLVFVANSAAKTVREPFTFYFVVCLGFLMFTSVSILVIKWLEKYFTKGVSTGEII